MKLVGIFFLLAYYADGLISGLVFKKGKFSVSESETLKQAIENYRIVSFPPYLSHIGIDDLAKRNDMTEQQLNELIFAKGSRNKVNNAFWFDISESNMYSKAFGAD